MGKTTIAWTERTWNCIRGCTRISPGCTNCYAERMAARGLPGLNSPTTGEPFAIMAPSGPRWTGRVELIPDALEIPLRRRKPTTWFVNSMSDLFHESLSDESIDMVFAMMALCPQHRFQILTKRAERMARYFATDPLSSIRSAVVNGDWQTIIRSTWPLETWPLPNVWLGVSVEDQKRADERIPHLLRTPAAVRFLSCEPLLGPVDLSAVQWDEPSNRNRMDVLRGGLHHPLHGLIKQGIPAIDWVIVGGESGPGARPCNVDWVRSIVLQCEAAGVPAFVKQWGANAFRENGNPSFGDGIDRYRFRDKKGGDPAEWPEQFPREMPK